MRQEKRKIKTAKAKRQEKPKKPKKPRKHGPFYRWRHRKETAEYREKKARKEFLDMIAPTAIRFDQGGFICGNTYRCVWVLREYPSTTDEQAVLHRLGEMDGVNIHIYTRYVNEMEQRAIIQNADKHNKFRMSASNNDLNELVRAEEDTSTVVRALEQSLRNREPFFHAAVFIELVAFTEEQLRSIQSIVGSELVSARLNVDKLLLRQKDGFVSALPTGYNAFRSEFERVLPASSVANLYPFSYSGRTDPKGIYLGYDKCGSNIIVDFEKRTQDQTNGSIVILGNSGMGKSHLTKLLTENTLEQGRNIIMLDAEGEYEDLTNNLGGTYLNLGQSGNMINPLQPLAWNGRGDEPDDSDIPAFSNASLLAQHKSYLGDFFKVYKQCSQREVDVLSLLVEKLYDRFGIISDSKLTDLPAEAFPTFSDLAALIRQEQEHYNGQNSAYTLEQLCQARTIVESICESAGIYFDGHTTITNTRFLVINTKGLGSGNGELEKAMLFSAFHWMYNALIIRGNTVAILDEAHLFLSDPILVGYIRNCMKRVRKYDSSMILATQDVLDFSQRAVADQCKTVFSIPTHKFLFNPGNAKKVELMDMLQLEECEYELIKSCMKGECLFVSGNERYHLAVAAPKYKTALFGNGGGR